MQLPHASVEGRRPARLSSILACVWATVACGAPAVNLVPNPGFEDGPRGPTPRTDVATWREGPFLCAAARAGDPFVLREYRGTSHDQS